LVVENLLKDMYSLVKVL